MPWRRNKGGGFSKRGQKRGGHVRSPRQYEALRAKGYSKQRAARITNASGTKPRRRSG